MLFSRSPALVFRIVCAKDFQAVPFCRGRWFDFLLLFGYFVGTSMSTYSLELTAPGSRRFLLILLARGINRHSKVLRHDRAGGDCPVLKVPNYNLT